MCIKTTGENVMGNAYMSAHEIEKLCTYLQQMKVKQAVLFGSLARHCGNFDSDVDLAIEMDHVLTVEEKFLFIKTVAMITGRTVDLIDLKVVGLSLLGQILQYGVRLLGNDCTYAETLSRFVIDQADFTPYRQRILDARRREWIGC